MKAAGIAIGVALALIGAFLFLQPSESEETRRIQATIEADNAREQQAKYTPATADELFALVNEERAKVGVAPLVRDERLNQSAQWMADDMANRDYYAHEDPVTGAKIGLDKINELMGTSCSYVSENQIKGGGQASTNEALLSGWLDSKSHKEAMLNKDYTLSGIGSSTAKDGEIMIVQHFCNTAWDRDCEDVTSHDYNWNNDVICTNSDGSRFYTSYSGADAFLAQ